MPTTQKKSQVAALRRRWPTYQPTYIRRALVPYGENSFAPRVFAMTFWNGKGDREKCEQMTITIEILGRNDWRIRKVEITPAPGDAWPRDTFGGFPAKVLVDAAIAGVALGPAESSPRPRTETFAEYQRISKSRRAVTRDRIERAAKVYAEAVAAGDRAPVKRVSEALDVGQSMAARIVGMARKQQLLPPTTQGKAQA